MELSFFTTFEIGWLNGWIPSFAMLLVQILFMLLFPQGGKRAVDTSWYTPQDRRYALLSSVAQAAVLIVSVFAPFKFGTPWFAVGTAVYLIAFALFVWSFFSYKAGKAGETIQGGIYRYSRNPMYFFFMLGMLGVCIATASLWMFIAIIPFFFFTHRLIIGEERYCEATYGESYRKYKADTPRYFLIV